MSVVKENKVQMVLLREIIPKWLLLRGKSDKI